MTPRQELIKQSAARLDLWRGQKIVFATPLGGIYAPLAHHAIESIIDECLICKPGTLGAAMLAYYLDATEHAVVRLIYAVDAAVQRKGYWYEHEDVLPMIYSCNGNHMIEKRVEIRGARLEGASPEECKWE